MELQSEITPVRTDDHPRVVEVWEASVRATHHFLAPADVAFFQPLIPGALAGVAELVCVRDAAGVVVGFLGVEGDKVEMLFIHPDLRGRGIGRRLLRHAVDALGATRVDVNEQNEQAVGFYRKMGFVVVGRSELDGMGKPFPLLHLELRGAGSHAEDPAPDGRG
ncbi:MAG TPA: acetyltransferase [Longimicrobiaceae bacterium]|jgi:putative acetyltransferase